MEPVGHQSWRAGGSQWAALCEFCCLRTEALTCWLRAGQAAARQEGPDGTGQ